MFSTSQCSLLWFPLIPLHPYSARLFSFLVAASNSQYQLIFLYLNLLIHGSTAPLMSNANLKYIKVLPSLDRTLICFWLAKKPDWARLSALFIIKGAVEPNLFRNLVSDRLWYHSTIKGDRFPIHCVKIGTHFKNSQVPLRLILIRTYAEACRRFAQTLGKGDREFNPRHGLPKNLTKSTLSGFLPPWMTLKG